MTPRIDCPTAVLGRVPDRDRPGHATHDESTAETESAVYVLRAESASGPLPPPAARALELLYRRFASSVRDSASRLLRDAAEADDVTHDVFMKLPFLLRSYRPGNFGGWIRQVAVRAALMRLRRSARAHRYAMEPVAYAGASVWDLDVERLADVARVRMAVAELPASLREVLILRFERGESHGEIARQLGISVGASELRLYRAIKRLRLRLREE